MSAFSFFVVADRGKMKGYALKKSRGRGLTPALVQEFEIEEAGAKYAETLTDRAGEFPSNRTVGTAHSSGERLSLESEKESRCFRRLAEQLTQWLREYQPETWAFAAPAEINGAILDGLSKDLLERLVQNIRQDLTNIPTGDVLSHMNLTGAGVAPSARK